MADRSKSSKPSKSSKSPKQAQPADQQHQQQLSLEVAGPSTSTLLASPPSPRSTQYSGTAPCPYPRLLSVNQAFRVMLYPNDTLKAYISIPANVPDLRSATMVGLTEATVKHLHPDLHGRGHDRMAVLAHVLATLILTPTPLGELTERRPTIRIPRSLPVTCLHDVSAPPERPTADHKYYACLFPGCTEPATDDAAAMERHVITAHYTPEWVPRPPGTRQGGSSDRGPSAVHCFPHPKLFVVVFPDLGEERYPNLWDKPAPPPSPTKKEKKKLAKQSKRK